MVKYMVYRRIIRVAKTEKDKAAWCIVGLIVHNLSTTRFMDVSEVQRELLCTVAKGAVNKPDDYLYECFSSNILRCLDLACEFGFAESQVKEKG